MSTTQHTKMAESQLTRESENDNRSLSEIFEEAITLFEEITKTNEPESCNKVQADIKKCIQLLEQSTHLINAAGVFSSNETIEEVSTSNVKYLILPALLGCLVLKYNISDRVATLDTAEVYFKDFLKRIQDYEIIARMKSDDENDKGAVATVKKDLNDLARDRTEKIRKYREQQEMETELGRLKTLLKVNDDETSRNYYILYIKKFVNVALDELKSIKQEKPLAQRMAEIQKGSKHFYPPEGSVRQNDNSSYRPLKPIILTRNEIQKKIFGAGYPSLPTMTVSEFYENRVAEGIFPAHGSNYNKTLQDLADPEISKLEEEKQELRKEQELERDDPDQLMKARNMDDFKDDHRRGWGNRMNRS